MSLKNKRIRRSPEDARAQLVAAAQDALTTGDFANLTVAAVTARAGMTRSAFYHYFSGLDDLVMTLLETFESGIHDSVDAWLEGRAEEGGDFRRTMIDKLSAMYGVFHENRTIVRAAVQAANTSRAVFDQWQARAVDRYIDKTTQFIVRQVALGRSQVTDPYRVAKALILMNNAVGIDNMLRADPDDPADIGRTVGTIWNATIYGPADAP